ncbi:MAG: type II toxin-antitoxin system VapB family antitoxin [Aquisalimonadaceae bacterium]
MNSVVTTPEATTMRTTINIDDELLREAQEITGIKERTALINEGIRALIARESARRLARLGGSDPNLDDIPRRRPDSA